MAWRHPMVRSVLGAVLVIAGVAVFVRVAYAPWYLNYDTRYALLWASDLLAGFNPEYTAPFAPTPHPLWNALAVAAHVFGGAADTAMLWVVLLSFGAIVWLVFQLGRELFNPWVGAVAALVVLTRAAMLRDVVLVYLDVTFAALIVGAVLLEVRRPRRGLAVLVVLFVAGLLRPEAWALALLYVVYLFASLSVGDRVRYLALALAPAAIWFGSDAIVTGDALHSLHGTADLAEENERRRTVREVPYWTVQYFGFILRLPILIGVVVGIYIAWRRGIRRAHVPLVVAGLLVLGFAAGPLFGLPLIGRYLRTPAALLAVFYGAACFAWLSLPPSRERLRYAVVGLAVLALSLVYLPPLVEQLEGLKGRRDREARYFGSLRGLAESGPVAASFARCPKLTASDHRPVPHLRWWLDGDPGTVGTIEDATSAPGKIHVVPRRSSTVQRNYYRTDFPREPLPTGYVLLRRNRHWLALAAPECVRR